ncbi:integrase catalytic domain-containing protein [Nephila pilipes]|uniref:Integrase catalytic domain-containing protein n=1 Tax=Nephila pilipes TaxID=299642 RepID=A0A8X6MM57_NEPPI|nr:integrase catalytic domain-containing protein [Nephila pilipes]
MTDEEDPDLIQLHTNFSGTILNLEEIPKKWDDAQHISHLRQVFQRLQDAGLVIKIAKGKFSQTESPFQQYHNVSKCFTEINLDIIGPSSEGFRYCLTIIDRYSRWPEAIPLPDIRAETVADNLLKGWIAGFGIPLVITTDQGTQFEAQLFQELSKLIGFKRNRTT